MATSAFTIVVRESQAHDNLDDSIQVIDGKRRCICCSRLSNRVCSGCNLGKDPQYQAWYCSKACQLIDRPNHHLLCTDFEKHSIVYARLRATGHVLRQVFYTASEILFPFDTLNTRRLKVGLPVIMSIAGDSRERAPFPFPHRFAWTNQEKSIVLAYSRCAEACLWTQKLLPKLLGGESIPADHPLI